MTNLNYYPLKRVREKLGEEEVKQMIINPCESGRRYSFANDDGDYLVVIVNHHYTITFISFTPHYKGLGLSLKRAKRKGYKACWHFGTDKQVSL